MKLPLNDRLSPYSRGYKNILKDVHQQFVPITKFDEIKYIVILITPKIENNFIERFPKINYSMN